MTTFVIKNVYVTTKFASLVSERKTFTFIRKVAAERFPNVLCTLRLYSVHSGSERVEYEHFLQWPYLMTPSRYTRLLRIKNLIIFIHIILDWDSWFLTCCTVAICNKRCILLYLLHFIIKSSQFVITVAFCNKTVAFCNIKPDPFCNKFLSHL